MKLVHFLSVLICLFTFPFFANAQKIRDQSKIKFGDVTPDDFAPTAYSIDSSAPSIVLADIGESKFAGDNRGSLSINFTHFRRMRIMNKNGFDDASYEIYLRHSSNTAEDRIDKFEAVTYNLENGKVVATPLTKDALFKDKYNENFSTRKFTFPNLKEGSIIEFRYTIISPFYSFLRSWTFQGKNPRLWSEYTVTIPTDIFEYVFLKSGYLPYKIDTVTHSNYQDNFNFVGGGVLKSYTATVHWAMENVPKIKEEEYITTLDNYISQVKFQIKRITYSAVNSEDILGDWYQLADRFMKSEDFGKDLSANNGWLNDDLKKVVASATSDEDKVKKVYEYIRDNFSCKDDEGIYLDKPLKKVFQDKNGSTPDINLLLVAAMQNAGFAASPAILSTRDNGWANEEYPLITQYNYVLCRVQVGEKYYLLDASDPSLGFAKLSPNLYNGSARVIAAQPILIPLSSDSVTESSISSVFMMNDGKNISGTVTEQYGDFKSIEMRDKLKNTKPEDLAKEIKKDYTIDVDISNLEIDSLKIPEEPLAVKYDLKFTFDDDIVYFNPMLASVVKTNPFTSAERLYPVEMESCTDKSYVFNMEIPEGYKIDELPKSARVTLNENDGMFEYIIAQSGNRIQMRCRIVIKKATFFSDDYQTLRDFYTFIVKKEAEPIVFSKIK